LDEQRKQQRLFLIGSVVIAALLVGFLAILQRNKRRIEHQKQALTELNATKDKQFSIVAHDLRSPIGALKNLMTMTNYGMMSQGEFATASKRLTTDVNNLYKSLDNLLLWSHSQQEGIKAQPETIHLHAIAAEQIKLLTEIAAQKNITVVNDISTEATVFADPNQIGLVIRNLVSNSLKFTKKSGKIILESQTIPPLGGTRGATEGGKLELKIADNGIGMSKDIQSQLFKIQGNASRLGTSAEVGQGLGLILVKEMVEANGGTLHIESAEAKGTSISTTWKRA
jgi:signal transduction histidine kinase